MSAPMLPLRERERFDALVAEAVDALPPRLRALLDEAPLIVDDAPPPDLMREMGIESPDELCGLHSGVPLTERSVEAPFEWPDEIRIFRLGVLAIAGGWNGPDGEDGVYDQIWITLLHEIGHHFGLDEDDLDRLGYA